MKLGDLVHVVFLDHCHCSGGSAEPITCEVFGRIITKNKKFLTVASWLVHNEGQDANTESFAILTSAIVKARVLK